MRFHRPLAVFLVSAGTLTYEVLLVRLFAIEQFHHFASMAIGIAMLGFGASGTLFAVVRPARVDRWFARSAQLTAVALLAIPLLIALVRVDPTRLTWDVTQWVRLAALYALLAVPFATGALAILAGISAESERPGGVYGASFAGAGVGAATAVAILWVLTPARAVALPAVLASVGAALAASFGSRPQVGRLAATVTLAAATLACFTPPWRLQVIPYKALPQVSALPGATRVAQQLSPVGWLVAVDAAAFRYLPGLSLAYRGSFPRQTALFVDADLVGASTTWRGARDQALLDWLPTAAPYAIATPRTVLVLGAGGGLDVANGIEHGALSVTAVELHPGLAEWTAVAGNGAPPGAVRWIVGDARSAVASSPERFDLITVGPIGGGVRGAGVRSLNEDFLHTIDGYEELLAHLADDGILAITGWTAVPPRTNVRIALTVIAALRRVGPERARHGVVVVRSWGTVTTLVKPSGFTPGDLSALGAWAETRLFDLEWYPGITSPENRFNLTDTPALFDAVEAALAGTPEAEAFARDYPFDVRPATDGRPYPHHYVGANALGRFLNRGPGDWLPFAEWGYLALIATLAQSVILAAALLVLPLLARRRVGIGTARVGLLAYFGAIGFAYLAAEIAVLQHFALLLGHPVYAVAAVLGTMLVASGIGSAWSDRFPARLGWVVALALGGWFLLNAALLLPVVHAVQSAAFPVRLATGVLLVAPAACFMGMPFPLGLRLIAGRDPGRVAWAWAMNGFASVIAAPAAALLALEVGTSLLFVVAGGAYALASVVDRRALAGRERA